MIKAWKEAKAKSTFNRIVTLYYNIFTSGKTRLYEALASRSDDHGTSGSDLAQPVYGCGVWRQRWRGEQQHVRVTGVLPGCHIGRAAVFTLNGSTAPVI
ncbi:hypothetical protein E2C01_082233 [Portunus trituberculatus]|uniref:Uncharacterized protein n=1 Tax=Portunus trituberculatus TaxID=210409 RepID=A0A5B7ITZ5_PORTR|nr:hypothetical protein [Portunus trituberculatus]